MGAKRLCGVDGCRGRWVVVEADVNMQGRGDAEHALRRVDSVFQSLEIEMNEWAVAEHAGKLPRLFP
jgi:predicted RNase H-like nuclease